MPFSSRNIGGTMQTRRKSLNLGDLGVIAPKRSRTTSHPSPPETVIEGEEPPVKKSKRSHASLSPPPGLMSPPLTTVVRLKDNRSKPATALSPPPSPGAEISNNNNNNNNNKVDTEGISDDIVVATIQQLETTGNRPHLVKELAATLAMQLRSVEKSANPCALISSRLTAYLHRSWPAISPCPLAKDLSPVHPRRLYFYLTTTPHQPIPEIAEPIPKVNRIISPSLSSASAVDEEDREIRQRQALSPSPEVDLSSPELEEDRGDAPPTPGASFTGRNSIPRERTSFAHPRRAASPPLENEERDFKQTASALYEQAKARRNSLQSQNDINMDRDASAGAEDDAKSISMSIEADETEEIAARRNSEAAAALFGSTSERLKVFSAQPIDLSSPLLQPQMVVRYETLATWADDKDMAEAPAAFDKHGHHGTFPESALAWGESLENPESVELDELDDMFDSY